MITIFQIVGKCHEEAGPRGSNNVFGIVFATKQNDLTPLALGARSEIHCNIVSKIVSDEGDPSRVGIDGLDSTFREGGLMVEPRKVSSA